MSLPDGQLEWLETNALGSFCLAAVDRKLRRKYHALLTVRDPGRGDAWNLLAETRETLERDGQSALLVDPLTGVGSHSELRDFCAYPHATHRYRALDVDVERSVRLGEHDQVEIRYTLRNVRDSSLARGTARFDKLRFSIEPLLRCRPLHELTHENPFLDGACVGLGEQVRMLPYAGMPAVALRVYEQSARFQELGSWISVERYEWEAARGYPASEALFSPGRFVIEVSGDATFTFVVGLHRCAAPQAAASPLPNLHYSAKLERAAAQFFMRSGARVQAVVAGFPWFGAWSRDALIALPGMYLASADWERCEAVLDGLAKARVRGLIPNIPALAGTPVNTSSVDASLLFVRTVQWFGERLGKGRVARFMPVVCELLESLADGEEPRMRFDHGVGVFTQPGPYALTWMDALVDGLPVTPRAGYAVDIDALAYNAAHFACAWADEHRGLFARAFRTRLRRAEGDFLTRYWDDARGYLADGCDEHGQHGHGRKPDPSLRPNQLWALALPFRPVSSAMARSALTAVTRELLTPVGLRTLSPHDPAYRGTYAGAQPERDRAYHQGTVWPWLLGIYADAVLTTLGRAALEASVGPVLARLAQHLDAEGCIGHISEVFDGDAPHAAAGAPAQAWSVAEVYRSVRLLHAVESQQTERGKMSTAEQPTS